MLAEIAARASALWTSKSLSSRGLRPRRGAIAPLLHRLRLGATSAWFCSTGKLCFRPPHRSCWWAGAAQGASRRAYDLMSESTPRCKCLYRHHRLAPKVSHRSFEKLSSGNHYELPQEVESVSEDV